MKKLFAVLFCLLLNFSAYAQFSFYLIDNFEDGNYTEEPRWWKFGDLKAEILRNPELKNKDLIAQSCGDYRLNLSGESNNWYVGGIGTDLSVDATQFSRFQIDLYGDKEYRGKVIVELFEDDNGNYSIEQDPQKGYAPVYDDKWVAEINLQGEGFTRISIPFTAFKDANPGVGDDTWNPDQKKDSGGLAKIQLIIITEQQSGKVNFGMDNLLLTY